MTGFTLENTILQQMNICLSEQLQFLDAYLGYDSYSSTSQQEVRKLFFSEVKLHLQMILKQLVFSRVRSIDLKKKCANYF